jgi:hypothetical protein
MLVNSPLRRHGLPEKKDLVSIFLASTAYCPRNMLLLDEVSCSFACIVKASFTMALQEYTKNESLNLK